MKITTSTKLDKKFEPFPVSINVLFESDTDIDSVLKYKSNNLISDQYSAVRIVADRLTRALYKELLKKLQ